MKGLFWKCLIVKSVCLAFAFDNVEHHRYKPNSLEKLHREGDEAKTPLDMSVAALRMRVVDKKWGAGTITFVEQPKVPIGKKLKRRVSEMTLSQLGVEF